MPSVASKFKKVIERNTFYFQNYEFEQENEAYVHSMLHYATGDFESKR